jgi:hypothetical protein
MILHSQPSDEKCSTVLGYFSQKTFMNYRSQPTHENIFLLFARLFHKKFPKQGIINSIIWCFVGAEIPTKRRSTTESSAGDDCYG